MEIIVASDSHGQSEFLEMIEKWHPHADLYLHCGDLEDDSYSFPNWIFVRGNNDYFSGDQMPLERVISIGNQKLFMCHSHTFPYFQREKALARRAIEEGCSIVCYGHTHCSSVEWINDVLVLNPGSLWWPRDGKEPSYAIIHVDGSKIEAELRFQRDWPCFKK